MNCCVPAGRCGRRRGSRCACVCPFLRSLYNNIKTPGQLTPNATYYLFKEGIEPKWEEPKNAKGGAWTASIPTNKGDPKKVVDAWWLNSVGGGPGGAGGRIRMCDGSAAPAN